MFISNAYAQTTTAADPGLMANLTTFAPLIIMFVVMYFLMIRPQQKRQKEMKAMMEALTKGYRHGAGMPLRPPTSGGTP